MDIQTKYNKSKLYLLLFNIFIHSFILICILSALFWKVIKQEMDENTSNQINSGLDKSINSIFNSIQTNEDFVVSLRSKKEKIIDSLEQKCGQLKMTDDLETNHRKIAMNNIIFGGVIFICMCICAFKVYHYSKELGSNKKKLVDTITLNVILFILVGICELTFFEQIASKYIPIDPSDVNDVVYDTLTTNIGKKIEENE